MELPNEVLESIRMQIRAKEACGILTKAMKVIPITNVSDNPNTFVMSKFQYMTALNEIKNSGDAVLAIYHTHPFCSSKASKEDLYYFNKAKYDMLIVSVKDWSYYHAKDN